MTHVVLTALINSMVAAGLVTGLAVVILRIYRSSFWPTFPLVEGRPIGKTVTSLP